jgi:hypothetical protein
MSKKRQMWVQTCIAFAVLWGVLGVLIWPFLLLAVASLMMMLIPVGVDGNEQVTPRHDPDAWRRNTK